MLFENLSTKLCTTLKMLSGQGRLTESNIEEALRDVRIALLEADVALPVVKTFIEKVKTETLGEKVAGSLTPGQAFIKLVHDELVLILGSISPELNLKTTPPAVILLAGLQGSGKTTTAAKLAKFIKNQFKKTVLLVSTDIYRPAAMDQLIALANQIETPCYPKEPTTEEPLAIVTAALDYAKKHAIDVVLIDSAGRLHIDSEMMAEIRDIHRLAQPIETLFIVDSMTGQDAVHSAKSFDDALPLTGVILTKTDGDARGGAALTVWSTIHKPIKFIGTGEKIDALEWFHPDRIASRILGMGDIVSLAEEVQQKVDKEKAEKLTKKIKKGKSFDLDDFLEQIEQMGRMGGIASLVSKLPGFGNIPDAAKAQLDDSIFSHMKAAIQSMTKKERRFPHIINGSRKRRITQGSGTTIQELNRLLKQFEQIQKVMKKMSNPLAMFKMTSRLQQLMGGK